MSERTPEQFDFTARAGEPEVPRNHTRQVVEQSQERVAKIWDDIRVPELPPYVDDLRAANWQKRGLLLHYLPPGQVEPGVLERLEYGMTKESVQLLRDHMAGGYDAFAIEGGWFLIHRSGFTVDDLDMRAGVELEEDERLRGRLERTWYFRSELRKYQAEKRGEVFDPVEHEETCINPESYPALDKIPPATALDLLYSPEIRRQYPDLVTSPRLPRAMEMLLLRNTVGAYSGEPGNELCADVPHTTGWPKLLQIRFREKDASVMSVTTRQCFTGTARPMWRLPSAEELLLRPQPLL